MMDKNEALVSRAVDIWKKCREGRLTALAALHRAIKEDGTIPILDRYEIQCTLLPEVRSRIAAEMNPPPQQEPDPQIVLF